MKTRDASSTFTLLSEATPKRGRPACGAMDQPPAAAPAARGLSPQAPGAYKVVETSTVTDESLEAIINEWVSQGWLLDGIHFAMRESSKRPAMAFVLFSRQLPPGDG